MTNETKNKKSAESLDIKEKPSVFNLYWKFIADVTLIAVIVDFIKEISPGLVPIALNFITEIFPGLPSITHIIFFIIFITIVISSVIMWAMYVAITKLLNEKKSLPKWIAFLLIFIASLITTYQIAKYDKEKQHEKILEKGITCTEIQAHANEKIIVKVNFKNQKLPFDDFIEDIFSNEIRLAFHKVGANFLNIAKDTEITCALDKEAFLNIKRSHSRSRLG